MTFKPYVAVPDAWLGLLTAFRTSLNLPAELNGRVCAELPEDFPGTLPLLHVFPVPGNQTLVPFRLWKTSFDLNLYAATVFDAYRLARQVLGVCETFVQLGVPSVGLGFTEIDTTPPFPLQDFDTHTERVIISISTTYRPL